MEVLDEPFRAEILDAVNAWAAPRYGERRSSAFAEQAHIYQTSSDSEADYIVSLNILAGLAPRRVKVFFAPDGGFLISG